MNLVLFWSLVLGIQALCLAIAFIAARKQKSTTDYYLAGRQMAFFPLLMTFVATQVGGGLILGTAEEAYQVGWKIIFFPLGYIFGFLLLGTVLGRRLSALPVSTVAQIFEYAYGSKRLKQMASLLSMITLFLITVAQVLASQKFLGALGFVHPFWFMAFWAVVLLYTMWGGLEGIASIDVVQASFFLIVFAASLFFVLSGSAGRPADVSLLASSADLGPETWVAWFLMPCLFMLIEQDIAQRCFSARSAKTVKMAAWSSALIVFLVCLVPISIGLIGKAEGVLVPKGQSALMALVQILTSPALSAAVACAVMMAIISTAVSLIHSVSSNLTQDFRLAQGQGRRPLLVSRAVTLAIGIAALLASTYFDSIVGLLIQSYELSVVCLFVPVFMHLLGAPKKVSAALCAMLFGALGFVTFRLWPPPFSKEVLELAASLLGFALGSLFERKKEA